MNKRLKHSPAPWRWDGNYIYAKDGTEVLFYTINDNGIEGLVDDKTVIAEAPQVRSALIAAMTLLGDLQKLAAAPDRQRIQNLFARVDKIGAT